MRIALILAVLYIGEVILLFGWWSFLKERLKTLFTVS